MFTSPARSRFTCRLAAASVLVAASAVVLGTPLAAAGPPPEIHSRQTCAAACPDYRELAALLRSRGLTAQAANIAAQLTVRSCRR